ncbi:MAG: GrpB family protein [Bacilli bacterium]|nr:GrpB family protein [Bacilli bacterium]MBN2876327.1 GrpB family protein [Bacilli bacterium]
MTRHVVVTEYQEVWKKAFEELKAFLESHLNSYTYQIEHIGSTSVEGLKAKPIIDLMILIPDKSHFENIKSCLEKNGYIHNGDQGIKDREVFKSTVPDRFYRHHLYVSYPDALPTKNQITLRDHLRTHPKDKEAYGNLKQKLAEQYEYDIDSYVRGKTDLILSILKQYDFTEEELKRIYDANQI